MGHVSTIHKAPFCKENHQKRRYRNRPRPKETRGLGWTYRLFLADVDVSFNGKQASKLTREDIDHANSTHHEGTTSDMHLKIEKIRPWWALASQDVAQRTAPPQNWVIPARHVSTSTSPWLESRFFCFGEGVECGPLTPQGRGHMRGSRHSRKIELSLLNLKCPQICICYTNLET